MEAALGLLVKIGTHAHAIYGRCKEKPKEVVFLDNRCQGFKGDLEELKKQGKTSSHRLDNFITALQEAEKYLGKLSSEKKVDKLLSVLLDHEAELDAIHKQLTIASGDIQSERGSRTESVSPTPLSPTPSSPSSPSFSPPHTTPSSPPTLQKYLPNVHAHALVFYQSSGWGCDVCKKRGSSSARYRCTGCNWDICNECLAKAEKGGASSLTSLLSSTKLSSPRGYNGPIQSSSSSSSQCQSGRHVFTYCRPYLELNSGFQCNGCRITFPITTYSHHCECNYDLCDTCKTKTEGKGSMASGISTKTKYVPTWHPHSLNLCSHDNGWTCDGRSRSGGCKRIRDGTRTSGVPRFRCETCDYDLCDKCVDAAEKD